MEAICSSKTSVDCQRIVRHYIQEDGTLHNHRCEKLKSYKHKHDYFDVWVKHLFIWVVLAIFIAVKPSDRLLVDNRCGIATQSFLTDMRYLFLNL
jgi:hypothetical protein